MSAIQHLGGEFRAQYHAGDLVLLVDAFDEIDQRHSLAISSHAVMALANMLDEARALLMDQLPDRPMEVTVTQGPTRGEVYAVEVEL